MGFFMTYVYEVVGGMSHFELNMINIVPGILELLATFFAFPMLADRVSHRLLFFIGAACGLVVWSFLVFVGIDTRVGLWTFLVIWSVHSGISAQCFSIHYGRQSCFQSNSERRPKVLFSSWFVVPLGIWFIFFPIILGSIGFVASGSMMIAFLTISFLIGTIWTPNTRGKTLDQVNEDRYGAEYVTNK